MRIYVVVLSLLFPVLVSAQENVLEKRLTRQYEQESILFILKDLERKFKLPIKYNASLLPTEKYSYSFEDLPLESLLSVLLDKTDLTFISDDKSIIVLPRILVEDASDATSKSELNQSTEIADEANQNTFVLLGSAVDSISQSPLASALVFVEELDEFSTTDQLGQFTFNLKEGQYRMIITSLTHERKIIDVLLERDTILQIDIKQKAYLIDEVVIESKAQQFNVRESSAGLTQLSQREIKQISSFMGESDVIKSILTLAGVNNIGEGTSGFNVRGGAIDQNLILQDGSVVYNPSHILGFFSSFNPDIVREILLYKGHIPAHYGGRSSSVLDVIIKEPDYKMTKGNISLGLISSKVAIEQPLIPGKTSLLASGRASYASWLLQKADNPDVRDSDARFYDVNLKLAHKITENSKLLASFFQSYDEFRFTDEFGYNWRNRIMDLTWKNVYNENISSSVQFSHGDILNEQFEPAGFQAFNLSSGIEYNKFHAWALIKNSNHTFRLGGEWLQNMAKPEVLNPIDSSFIASNSVQKDNSQEWALFINDDIDISPSISVSAGIRFNLFQQKGPGTEFTYLDNAPINEENLVDSISYASGETIQSYTSLEPRISVRYSLNEKSSIKFSYNRIAQNIHLVSNTATPTPIDIWQVSTEHIPPIRANNFSAGYFLNLSENDFEFSLEGYYKLLKNTVDYRDFAELLLNPRIETAILVGKGKSYGLEFTTQKNNGNLTGRFSYSYSKSIRQVQADDPEESINRGNWYPSNFDQPHTAKLLMNWQVNKRTSLSLNFIYSSGRPITAPVANYTVQDVVIAHFTDRNEYRIPDYHRMDVSFKLRLSRRSNVRVQSFLSFSIYNVYSRKNAFSIFYKQNLESFVNAQKLSIVGAAIPSLSLSLKF